MMTDIIVSFCTAIHLHCLEVAWDGALQMDGKQLGNILIAASLSLFALLLPLKQIPLRFTLESAFWGITFHSDSLLKFDFRSKVCVI